MIRNKVKDRRKKSFFSFLAVCSLLFTGVFILSSCSGVRYVSHPEERYPEPHYPKKNTPEHVVPKTKNIVASWYGEDFHGKPTSSGEIYNMYAKTCAHREYPFGTKLRVTNTLNGKSTECIVNDRGPFVPGRDIDLSYACARDIGLIGTGTGNVKIDYLGRDMGYVRQVKYTGISKGPFTIQVGSFKEPANASRLKKALEFKYDRVYVIDTEIDGSIYYRVRIGKFNTKEDAFSLAKTLADEGYSILITGYNERI